MPKLRDLDIPQWAVIITCGLLAFLGQWIFVMLTSKATTNELATHELRQVVAVQRADFEASRKLMDQQFTTFQQKLTDMYADITKRLDRMEVRQEETQKLLLQRQPPTR